MTRLTWLAMGYQVPIHPSKCRVYVWRKLKEYGAEYFKAGVALLPKNATNMTRFRDLARKIREMGGEATIAELRLCDSRDEREMIEKFTRQSQGEYQELIADLETLSRSIRDDVFMASGGNDQVKKLGKRYKQVRSRDYFRARAEPKISQSLDELMLDMAYATDDLARHLVALLSDAD
jgi:hypothetical protein